MRSKGYFLTVIVVAALVAGYARVRAYADDIAVGEQHEMPFPADQALELVEDVLRGEGILFDVMPDKSIITLWKPADNRPGFFSSLGGMKPQYRYEIVVVPEGGAKSNIVANVRTEYVPEDQIASYKASQRFDMFHKLDSLAATLPPERKAPSEGGVNFALLPNEDLRGLAQRVTGNPDNWKVIAQDNGLTLPTDVTPFQSIWVPDTMIKSKPAPSAPHAP